MSGFPRGGCRKDMLKVRNGSTDQPLHFGNHSWGYLERVRANKALGSFIIQFCCTSQQFPYELTGEEVYIESEIQIRAISTGSGHLRLNCDSFGEMDSFDLYVASL